MTSDETPREPQGGDRARSTGSAGSTDAGTPVSASQQWSGPPGPSQGSGDGQNGTSAEPRPQAWSSPPDGGGESRVPGRLPASTWIVALIGATVHAVALTLILALALPILTLASLTGGTGLLIVAPVVALALTVFLFWAFRRMLAAARFPRPTAAMVLFTTVVFAAFGWNVALQLAFGTGEPAEGILTAGVITAPLAALVMLASRGARVRWAAAVSAVVLVVAGATAWAQSQAQEESMLERQRQTNLGHEDEAAVLDAGGWEPYRSEINDAAHGTGDTGAGESGADGAGEEEWLSVFTVFYQDGDGGYLRTATWADERTAEDPEAVLREWCDGEGAYCQDLEVEGADGPVVAQWALDGSESAGEQVVPEDPEALGAPDAVRYEYEPGRVVYLGPWTQEPDRSQGGGPGGSGGEAGSGPGAGATLGHADFEARELAEWATQVRPAQEEDLVDLADRTVEYFQGPEDVLTGP
ncbi:hypothetical protein [Nocardiopsis xinjiangensis]|uniref:hypothetical protein n=1 Tax=Nocardiopsis xinjiangensis TaxID=124285 RepID=UPI00037B4E74|nr:hypothetical protein [Nocardiopsis xinjiangensis]